MELTLSLQDGMTAELKNGVVVIKIKEECKRDLWKGQITFYLENEKVVDSGNIRISYKNKITLHKHK